MVTDKKRKVLLFAKSVDGGTGAVALSLQKLSHQGFEIVTYVLEQPSRRKIDSIHIHYLHKKNFYPHHYSVRLSSIKSFFEECIWFWSKCKEESPTCVISLDVHCNLIAVISKLLVARKPRYILTTHINLKDTLKEKGSFIVRYITTVTVSLLYNSADLLTASTIRMKASLINDFGVRKKIVVIPYGINATLKGFKRIRNREKVILSIGRMVEQKDFSTLIDAYEKVRKESDKCRLVLIGEGPLKKTLMKRAQQSPFASSISFVGWKNNTFEWIAKSDIFVLTSKREGFPIVLLEAIVAGTPIVSTDAPYGPSEMLGNGKYGILAKVGDSEGIAQAILNLINDKKLYNHYVDQLQIRRKKYTEERMLISYEKAIRGLLSKPS